MKLREAPELGDADAGGAFSLAAAIGALARGLPREAVGVALGLAIGRWAASYGAIEIQEQALNRVLIIAAKAAESEQEKMNG